MESRYKLETPSLEVTEQNSTKLCQHNVRQRARLEKRRPKFGHCKNLPWDFFFCFGHPVGWLVYTHGYTCCRKKDKFLKKLRWVPYIVPKLRELWWYTNGRDSWLLFTQLKFGIYVIRKRQWMSTWTLLFMQTSSNETTELCHVRNERWIWRFK